VAVALHRSPAMIRWLGDLRPAFRSLGRTPGLTLAAILTLALGAGSTIAMGTIVYSLLFRPLPEIERDDLYVVRPTEQGAIDTDADGLSLAETKAIAGSGALGEIAQVVPRGVTLTGGEPERVQAASVTPNFFTLAGVRPLLGRVFGPADARVWGAEESAVLGYGLWQRRFGGDPGAIGKTIGVNQRASLAELEPDSPVYDLLTYPARLRETWEDRRLVGRLTAVFSIEGMALAAVGLFGVLAFAIARRTRELGIRMALGADAGRLVAGVMGDGLRAALPGLGVGLLLSYLMARTMTGALYGVDPLRPVPFLVGIAALAALAAGAAGLAGRRAAEVDPAVALRQE
jgi:hypothetical protein